MKYSGLQAEYRCAINKLMACRWLAAVDLLDWLPIENELSLRLLQFETFDHLFALLLPYPLLGMMVGV